MSSQMATIHLTGNMVSNPEMKHRTEDAAMAVFRMAVNHRYQDRNGQWVDGSPTFVTVQCWGKLAQNVVSDGYKGMPVVVVGRLYQSTWTAQDSGEKRSALRIRASHVGADMGLRRVTVTREEPVGNKQQSGQDDADVATSQAEGAPADNVEAGSETEERDLGAAAPPF